MRVKLEKFKLLDPSAVDAMSLFELRAYTAVLEGRLGTLQDYVFRIKRRFFGKQSEKSSQQEPSEKQESDQPKERGETTKKLSKRYPEATTREERVDFPAAPQCTCCGAAMSDSGMTEDSEYLDVQTKEFVVVDQRRQKHRCPRCHGGIATAPLPPRITPGGSYSDGFIIDATLSKYCDLIPVERYCQMAARGGLVELPPHSVIQVIFKLADLLGGVYQLIKNEVLAALVLLADETPHRMLEGAERKRWYLWGFSCTTAAFFECHGTRSGDVSTKVLEKSRCVVLVSDAYTGYLKSVREANKLRGEHGLPLIVIAYCNAHARRQFYYGEENTNPDAKFMLDQYEEIYRLNGEAKGLTDEEILAKRSAMRPFFEAMKAEALLKKDKYSSQSGMNAGYEYFLKYYDGLTLFLKNPAVPIDNNPSERLLRSPVVGRKTWYGTHSPKGAEVAAVHFTIVETCKMNGVNPREFYSVIVDRIHRGQPLVTPSQYKNEKEKERERERERERENRKQGNDTC